MGFFEDVDSLGIVENHIQQVQKLEDSQATSLLKTYRKVRGELRDRLDILPGDSFSAQQLRGVLVQVDAAIIAMQRGLTSEIRPASIELAGTGAENLEEEIAKFSDKFSGAVTPINLDAVAVATDTSNFLFNRFESSIDAYSKNVRAILAQNITQAAIEEISLSELTRRLNRYLIGEEWKLQRIARTELHNVYNLGKLNSMNLIKDDAIPDLMKTLIHPMDKRTGADSKYVAALDLIKPIDEPFIYTWKGQRRVYMTPPDRPNDRSILVPYRREWDN